MHAIAFETDVRQGIIRIPLQYRTQLTTHVKVILLQEEHDEQADRQGQPASFEHAMGFDAIVIDTMQWKFQRAEIYERCERV